MKPPSANAVKQACIRLLLGGVLGGCGWFLCEFLASFLTLELGLEGTPSLKSQLGTWFKYFIFTSDVVPRDVFLSVLVGGYVVWRWRRKKEAFWAACVAFFAYQYSLAVLDYIGSLNMSAHDDPYLTQHLEQAIRNLLTLYIGKYLLEAVVFGLLIAWIPPLLLNRLGLEESQASSAQAKASP